MRRSILGALVISLPVLGCATASTGHSGAVAAAPVVQDPAPRAGAPAILIAMPGSPDFIDVRRGLVSEVQNNFNVSTLLVTHDTSVAQLAVAVERVHPACVVLMDNFTLNLFRAYEAAHQGEPAIPTLVVMTSFLENFRTLLRRATGIAYEVPGVTAFVNLRAIVARPIKRVGVVYRPAFKGFIRHQSELALREHVVVVEREVPRDVTADGLREALHALIDKDQVDALWMLNDNLLVRDAEFLDQTWRAELRASSVPLVVGVPNLVDPASPLGTLAVVPDHESLGLQAGNLIFELADAGWQMESHPVDLPLSVKTIVDIRQVRNSAGLRPDALGRIDKALE
jgi:putative ABC transport system substrate-binding protein